MRVAHLVLPKAAAMELVDEMAARKSMVDDRSNPTKRVDPKGHRRKASELHIRQRRDVTRHTVVL